jgi:translocation protein SEC63
LTDEDIRRNYEEYGHPDGKQEFSIGIALPKWIVESSNGYYVLGFYGLLFGVLLPAFVGRWWYGSRNLTKEGIETETAARYFKAVKEDTSDTDVVDMLASSHELEVVRHPNRSSANLKFSTSARKLRSHINSILSNSKRNLLRQMYQSPKALMVHNIDSSKSTRYFPSLFGLV